MSTQHKGLVRRQHGFTLVELMVVVSIIGILAALGVPKVMSYIRTSETAEVAQNSGRIIGSIFAYADTQGKDAATIVTELDGVDVTPDLSGLNELADFIPTVVLPKDSRFDYLVSAIVATAGPQIGEPVFCIKATGRSTAGTPNGLVFYSSVKTASSGWDGHINRVPYVKGETDTSSLTAGGHCSNLGVAVAGCTNC